MSYSNVIDSLWPLLSAMDLGLGAVHADAQRKLQSVSPDELFAPRCIQDRHAALACLAGLHLLIIHVDGAHKIAQNLATPEGCYWHAIVHRRDGDFWNAKYWLRKVGRHPVFEVIGQAIRDDGKMNELVSSRMCERIWDPSAFVDEVEQCVKSNAAPSLVLAKCQEIEWVSLFDYCWQDAVAH